MLREFKDAPVVWGGVLLLLVVVQTTVSTIMVMLANADTARVSGFQEQAQAFHTELSLLPLPAMLIVSVFVILSVVSSAVNQRRRAIALLTLQGATPTQLTLRVTAQVLLLSVIASLVSLLASPLLARGLYPVATVQMEATGLPFVDITVAAIARAWALGTVLGIAVAMLAALMSIRAISRIAPVEALHEASNPPRTISKQRAFLAGINVVLAFVSFTVGYFSTTPTSMEQMTSQITFSAMSPMFAFCSLGMILLVAAISVAGPTVLAWTVRMWTRALPFQSASWRIACEQAEVRVRRSSPIIIPLVAGLTALMSIQGMSLVIKAWSDLLPGDLGGTVEVPGIARTLTLLAPALLVVVAGVLGGYLIAAEDRELDLALVSISGADTKQLSAISALDGIITAVTAVVLSFVTSTLSTFVFVLAEKRAFSVTTFAVPWGVWAGILLILTILAATVSWLVVRHSFHESPVAVVAQRVGQ